MEKLYPFVVSLFLSFALRGQGSDGIVEVEEAFPYTLLDTLPVWRTECPVNAEYQTCTELALAMWLASIVKYPGLAREAEREGDVEVIFVVEADGWTSHARAANDPGYGMAEAAVRGGHFMNKYGPSWMPGRLGGRAVRMQYRVLVHFRLN